MTRPRRQTTDFVFQTTGQTIGDAGLGRGVVGMSRLAKETGRRTDQDSRRIFQAVSDDAAEKLTQTEKDGGQIDGQRPIPLGQGHLLQRNFLGRPKAGVGHQDLHGAEVGFHGGEETPHLGFLRQIGLDGNAPRTQLARQFLNRLGMFAVVSHGARSLGRKGPHQFSPDTPRSTGHQDDPMSKFAVHGLFLLVGPARSVLPWGSTLL